MKQLLEKKSRNHYSAKMREPARISSFLRFCGIEVLLSITLVTIFFQTTFAQHDSSRAQINKAYIKSYFIDIKDVAVAPIHFKSKQWIETSIILGGTALISTQDIFIHDFFQRNRSYYSNQISKFIFEPWGSGVYTMPLLGLIYLSGFEPRNEKNKAVAMMGVKTFVITGLYGQIFKQLIHRHRPYQVYNDEVPQGITASQYRIEGPLHGFQYSSLPSGHTIAAFSVATIIAKAYKDEPFIPILAYAVATGTGLSRINDNDHWASDVFLGAAIGYAMGTFIYNENSWGINVLPYYAGNTAGAFLQMTLK